MSKSDERFIEKCTQSALVYDGKVVHLYVDRITLPDGQPSIREYVHHVGAVAVIPLTDKGEVICVRQYRYAHRQMMLEIPAGKLDSPEEDPTSAALRELREETGVCCDRLTPFGIYRSTPAILDERIYLYLAEGLHYGETDPDEDEFLEVIRLPLETLVDMVMSGEITDGKTQVAVLKTWELLRRRENGKGGERT